MEKFKKGQNDSIGIRNKECALSNINITQKKMTF